MKHTDYIVFDFETTGFYPGTAHVIQISALKVASGKVVEEFNRFIKIDFPVPAEAAAVHGITDAVLEAEGVSATEAWTDFLEFTGPDLPLVGHNIANFDVPFLEYQFREYGFPIPARARYVDTAAIYKAKLLEEKQLEGESNWDFFRRIGDTRAAGVYFQLTLLCAGLGIDISAFTAHRADSDVGMTDLIYRAWMENPELEVDELTMLDIKLAEVLEKIDSLQGTGNFDALDRLTWQRKVIIERTTKIKSKQLPLL